MSEDGKVKDESASALWTVVSREALIAGHKEDGRTVYRREAKARLVAAAIAPGASVARVARDHGLNANQLHGWIRVARRSAAQKGLKARFSVKVGAGLERAAKARAAVQGSQLVPVAIAASESASADDPRPSSAHASLTIEIDGARIVVEGASVDRAALRTVIDCLRESRAK